ncbi:MAG: hypothetical protein HPY85_17385 [Anaerolineae bacterium]|nr:hypothetical protein [Anaerolineae bacterium]
MQTPIYDHIAARVAAANLRMLSPFDPCLPADAPVDQQETLLTARRDLHAFFEALYRALAEQPAAFGIAPTPDDALTPGEADEKNRKQEITAKMKKPRDLLNQALDLLLHAGSIGSLEGGTLLAAPDDTLATAGRSRNLMKFMEGARLAGLELAAEGPAWRLRNSRFPAMMPALCDLAQACAAHPTANLGCFNFARCDFRALTQSAYQPDPADLYRAFDAEEARQLLALHAFFTARGYQTELAMGGKFDWLVRYQGSRKVKSTPLFQVEFQERYRSPLIMQVKFASTQRIAPLLPQQSPALQADFIQHTFRCRGDECGWCRNNKTLGPSVVEYNGEQVMLCWYGNRTVTELDPPTTQLIQEYALMHEQLAQAA